VLGVPEMPLRKIRVAYLRNFCILTVPRIPRVNGLRNGEDAMHTIKLKIHGCEFEASGEEATVNQQFADFMKAVASVAVPVKAPGDQEGQGGRVSAAGANGSAGRPEGVVPDLNAISTRLFRVDGNLISLNALPQGEDAHFDAVSLLLYAHDQLAGQKTVMVAAIINGLRQSGMQSDYNIARIVAGYESLVTKAGVKRGTRYGLTNRGRAHAEEALRRIF